MDKCPDNSTECLLRVLIQQSAGGSPWDAPTFGFTVAIGILAFSVSWVTVFQGLFAAGPGRLKASAAAIGKFSKLTKTRISWLELAYRSTASVPVITIERLSKRLSERVDPRIQYAEYGKDFSMDGNDAGTAASWLRLLRCVGLEDEISRTDHDPRKRNKNDFVMFATDFLPADVTAPPAAIQMSALAVMVAIADVSVVIDRTDQRVRIEGDISQISTRAHPILGSLVAYERYETRPPDEEVLYEQFRTPPYATKGRCSKLALDLARGALKIPCRVNNEIYLCESTCSLQHYSKRDTSCKFCTNQQTTKLMSFKELLSGKRPQWTEWIDWSKKPWAMWLALAVAQLDYQVRPFPWRRMNLLSSLEGLWLNWPVLRTGLGGIKSVVAACGFTRNDNQVRKHHMKPTEANNLFQLRGTWVHPDRSWTFHETFSERDINYIIGRSLEALDKWFKTGSCDDFYELDTREVLTAVRSVDMFLTNHLQETIEAYAALAATWLAHGTMQNTTVRSPSGSQSNAESFETPTPFNAANLRDTVAHIADDEDDDPISPMTRPNQLGEADQHGTHMPILNSSPDSVGQNTDQSTAYRPEEAARCHGLQTLLVMRAILCAACLELGPDTSAVFEDSFRDPIVKIL